MGSWDWNEYVWLPSVLQRGLHDILLLWIWLWLLWDKIALLTKGQIYIVQIENSPVILS